MKPKLFFRIAGVLMFLFALAHGLGFRQTDPHWGVDALIVSMQSIHFDMQGFQRSYWDIFTGFGFFVSLFLVFSGAIAWILGGLPKDVLARLAGIAWSLLACFVVLTLLSFKYFFTAPLVLSVLITICLAIGTWLSFRTA